jgi:hypothetical protein
MSARAWLQLRTRNRGGTLAELEPTVTHYQLQKDCQKLQRRHSTERRQMMKIGSTTERIITGR